MAQEPSGRGARQPREGAGRGRGNREGGERRERGPREGRGGERGERQSREDSELVDKLVSINRVAKVVKGGRRFGFAALVVVGDGKGRVGYGSGKAREVPEAIRKATDSAKQKMIRVPLREGRTLHHDVKGHFGAGFVTLRAAPPGTGVIAGGPMRAVFETLGIQDVVAKLTGSPHPHNLQPLRNLPHKHKVQTLWKRPFAFSGLPKATLWQALTKPKTKALILQARRVTLCLPPPMAKWFMQDQACAVTATWSSSSTTTPT